MRKKNPLAGAALFYYGEPMVWLTGSALVMCVVMILGFLLYVVYAGMSTFWPHDLVEYRLKTDAHLAGEIHIEESYELPQGAFASIPEKVRHDLKAVEERGLSERIMIRSCNHDITGTHFTWIDRNLIAESQYPEWLCFIERRSKKPFIGYFDALLVNGEERASGAEATWNELVALMPTVRSTFYKRHSLQKHDFGALSKMEKDARMASVRVKLSTGVQSQAYKDAVQFYNQVKEDISLESAHLLKKIEQLKQDNLQYQVRVRSASGAKTMIPAEEIVRMYAPNQAGVFAKLSIYCSRWWEFLSDDPRQANSQGGIWPALFGTVIMTMFMTILVVPFGVVAAIYMREYAKQGPLLSTIRISINNLAGVPSIVFGVFGLGFFCYIFGDWIDQTFYPAYVHESTPVFKKGGVLWASATLALLTLPVVIVATEEALAAVPNSMREGSYGCGASKWQSIRRIVLPRALPGILTGMILAMARGAGEVAPLMLVGAVKIAAELPTDPSASFMHLGFHIYDLSCQSPDSEAAKPMVFTTTLLLIGIVAGLNIMAIYLRNRLNKRFNIQTF